MLLVAQGNQGALQNINNVQHGQIVPLPPEISNKLVQALDRIGDQQQLAFQQLNAHNTCVQAQLNAITERMITRFQEEDNLDIVERTINLTERMLALVRQQQGGAFIDFINAAEQLQQVCAKGLRDTLDILLDEQWKNIQQQLDCDQLLRERQRVDNEAALRNEERRAEIARLGAAQQAEIGRANATNEAAIERAKVAQQAEIADRQRLHAILGCYNAIYNQDLAAAQIILSGNHANKKLQSVPPYIDPATNQVVPGKVTCEGVGIAISTTRGRRHR